jgi:excisionase family DNA binding protein
VKIKFLSYSNVRPDPPAYDDWPTSAVQPLAIAHAPPAPASAPAPLLDYLTVGEAAKVLRCSTKTVRRHIALGRLQATRAEGGSSRVLIARRSVERLLAAGTR